MARLLVPSAFVKGTSIKYPPLVREPSECHAKQLTGLGNVHVLEVGEVNIEACDWICEQVPSSISLKQYSPRPG